MDRNYNNIVFFDGYCVLCNSSVDFLLKNDRKHRLKFAPLQGKTARRLLPPALRENEDTVVYLQNGDIFTRSTAVLEACRDAGGWLKVFILLKIIPAFIRDFFYNLIARKRKRWFGQTDSCRLPSADEKTYFFD